MSVQAISAVIALRDVSPPQKLLLMALANYADHLNQCWPSLATIAAEIGVSRRHVARMMADLESGGHIERSPRLRDNKGCTSSLITLNLGAPPRDISVTSPSDTHVTTPVTPTSLAIEPPIEPEKEAKASISRATRIEADWKPSVDDVVFAVAAGLTHSEIEDEADGFRDYWLSRGRDAARRNWSLTFRTRIRAVVGRRKELAARQKPGGNGSGVADFASIIARRRDASREPASVSTGGGLLRRDDRV